MWHEHLVTVMCCVSIEEGLFLQQNVSFSLKFHSAQPLEGLTVENWKLNHSCVLRVYTPSDFLPDNIRLPTSYLFVFRTYRIYVKDLPTELRSVALFCQEIISWYNAISYNFRVQKLPQYPNVWNVWNVSFIYLFIYLSIFL